MAKHSRSTTAQSSSTAYTTPAARQPHPSGAFWLDPNLWDGISDPHREMCWMKRARDVIDVRAPAPAQHSPGAIIRIDDQYRADITSGVPGQYLYWPG